MRPTVPIALGGAGGPVMDAPEAFGIVYDPIETLAYVAAQTSRITLGTSVLDALFQSPIILARRLATLDRFSDGRLDGGRDGCDDLAHGSSFVRVRQIRPSHTPRIIGGAHHPRAQALTNGN